MEKLKDIRNLTNEELLTFFEEKGEKKFRAPAGKCYTATPGKTKSVFMQAATPSEETQLLIEWGQGNQAVLERLTPLVYDELRRRPLLHAPRKSLAHAPGHRPGQ